MPSLFPFPFSTRQLALLRILDYHVDRWRIGKMPPVLMEGQRNGTLINKKKGNQGAVAQSQQLQYRQELISGKRKRAHQHLQPCNPLILGKRGLKRPQDVGWRRTNKDIGFGEVISRQFRCRQRIESQIKAMLMPTLV